VPPRTNAPQKTRQSEVWSLSREEQFNWANGNISLCARLRPGDGEQMCVEVKDARTVSLNHQSPEQGEVSYSCDHTFGPEASQEQVYQQAVSPICEAVLHGYNGAVIAYGQTGSGKTHTMIGSMGSRGVAPQAVSDIFQALSKRQKWTVEVSVLEIYNEKVRDLLAPSVTVVDIHEVCDRDSNRTSFHCPDATCRKVRAPEEALMALSDGMRRRETARTDMNHTSSRSHLIFTLSVVQGDPEVGATLNGRLHIVDLAGSERLKRSMASDFNGGNSMSLHSPPPISSRLPRDSPPPSSRSPKDSPKATPRDSPIRDQRREAGEINKSLSQLALVIQRLTAAKSGSLHQVPYRDSMLTRLLAECFGGSSKTCLIITCSPSAKDREETRCSLDFGKRAKLVENKAEINVGIKDDSGVVMEALMQKEFSDLHRQKEEMLREREGFLKEREDLKSQLEEAQRDKENFVKQHEDLRSLLAEAQREKEETFREREKFVKEREDVQSQLAEALRDKESLRSLLAEAQRANDDCRSLLAEAHREKEVTFREREKLVKDREDLQSQLAEAQRLLVAAAAGAAKRHDNHISDVKRVEEENAAMRSRLEQTLAAVLSESRQLQDSRQARAAALEAERRQLAEEWQAQLKRPGMMTENAAVRSLQQSSQTLAAVLSESRQFQDSRQERAAALEAESRRLAEEWQGQLKRPSILTDNSQPLGSNSALFFADAIECSTADASIVDSSDQEFPDLL